MGSGDEHLQSKDDGICHVQVVHKKNVPNDRLTSFYAEYVIRKLELESYMQAQITEALLHARFLKMIGRLEETAS